jgi:hypothetical protein
VGKLMSYDRQPTASKGLKPVARVVDPALSAEARTELLRKIRLSTGDDAGGAGCSGVGFSILSAITLFILHFVIGLSWWWMIASVLPALIGFVAASALSARLDDRDHSHFVEASDLDNSSHQLMFRAQEAIRSVLGSGVYANNSLDDAVKESTLRRHEWEIAIALRKISRLGSEHEASRKGAPPGPMTASVLNSHRHALTLAVNATESRIKALEQYAAELKKADAADRDWRTALKASGRNEQYLDLIAATAADEHAIAEIRGLTEQAAAAAEVFREHLYQASLAAQALVLPTALQN